jgi:sulfonate transport system substrate-binding protein
LSWPIAVRAETDVIRIPRGAGGVGFLPLLIMEQRGLIERHARALGAANLRIDWLKLGGPAVVNDLLLSGAAAIVVAGPPAFLTLWDRTRETIKVKGIAAMSSIPMYLNTRAAHLTSFKDLKPDDKIALTAVKVSIPAIIMQMAALKEFGPTRYNHYDPFTVSLTHPDAVIALTSGRADITAHFASPPFHQRERKLLGLRTIMTSKEVMGGPSTFTLLYTTSRFHDANPKASAAFFTALEEAIASLNADKCAAAQTFIDMEARAMPLSEVLEVLSDPDIRYTTTPENVMSMPSSWGRWAA